MKKKILAVALASAMLIGASMSVSAATTSVSGTDVNKTVSSGNATGDSIEMLATVQEAAIEVEVKVGSTVVANPYGLQKGSVSADTLNGAVITFTNKSDTPIEVGLKGQIKLPDYTNSSKPVADRVSVATSKSDVISATTKQVFVQADVVGDASSSVNGKKVKDGAKYFSITNTNTGETKRVAPLVYDKTQAEIASNPVLAKSSNSDTTYSKEMNVVLSGATSISPDYAWGSADQFTVITFYDLKLASTPSKFVALSTTP